MRLHHLVAAAALSLVGCTFDATGLSAESSGAPNTSTEPQTTTTGDDTTGDPTTGDPTTGGDELCGNYQIDPGEECDGGPSNGTMGVPCKFDCKMNVCGDGYAASTEGCDDGNDVDDDQCSNACTLTTCGDGKLTPPNEQCDDGNQVDDDACSNLCKTPFCGDGNVGPDESCDDGALNNGDDKACTSTCVKAICGDGLTHVGVEFCDDGNAINDDGCKNDCQSADCGDGVVQEGEACDDGNDVDTDACTNVCAAAVCGDGIVGPDEACDDANPDNTDACTATCELAACGDGFVGPGEACDDGNDSNTDACVTGCKAAGCGDGFQQDGVEECDGGANCGEDCKIKACGNGVLQPEEGEQCDDGNVVGGDACGADCQRLGFTVFVTNGTFNGAFGSVVKADGLCNTAATTGKLPGAGKYKAWLSDDTTFAAMRLHESTIPYLRPDNVKVADDWGDLIDGDLAARINVSETKAVIGNGQACSNEASLVWTNTTTAGEIKGGEHCDKWTTSNMAKNGLAGLATTSDTDWTDKCTISCDTSARLYCIEQP